MTDITTIWDTANNCGDWAMAGSQLQSGNDLQTAVIISLFTDCVANPDDVIPDGTADPRGWIGDLGQQYPIGSRIWLLDRSKKTSDVLNKANFYIREALQWMLDDGVVAHFDITTQWIVIAGSNNAGSVGALGAQVIAYQQSGATSPPMKFAWVWQGQQ